MSFNGSLSLNVVVNCLNKFAFDLHFLAISFEFYAYQYFKTIFIHHLKQIRNVYHKFLPHYTRLIRIWIDYTISEPSLIVFFYRPPCRVYGYEEGPIDNGCFNKILKIK